MQNKSNNEELLQKTTIWVVWYEDRFGFGEDRDAAYVVTFFLTKEEADQYIHLHEGFIDIEAGKFDGLFTQEWLALDAIKATIVSIEDVQKLLPG